LKVASGKRKVVTILGRILRFSSRKAIGSLVITVFAAAIGAGQENVGTECPSVNILGPAGIAVPGEDISFSITLSGTVPDDIKYSWTVSEGKIVSGQDAQLLRVRTPKGSSYNVKATVKITGLSKGCPDTFSESAGAACKCTTQLIDAYDNVTLIEEKARLKLAAAKPKDWPESNIYVIVYPPKSMRRLQQRITGLRNCAKLLGLGRRFSIVIGPDNGIESGRIYFVPPGADDPQP
jgi:hypothetical protein